MKAFSIIAVFFALCCFSCQAQSITTLSDGTKVLHSNTSETNGIYVSKEGNLGIGTKNPKDKLEVNGQIHAKSVKLDLKEWADYVFDNDYTLLRLREIENYINTYGHLPEMPSTDEVIKNGVELGHINTLLLKKIEELTLHLIQKDHEVSQLQDQYKNLQSQIAQLQKQMNSISKS